MRFSQHQTLTLFRAPPEGYEDTTDHSVSVILADNFKQNVATIIDKMWIHGLIVRTKMREESYLKQGKTMIKG